jgi:hypothetical protein
MAFSVKRMMLVAAALNGYGHAAVVRYSVSGVVQNAMLRSQLRFVGEASTALEQVRRLKNQKNQISDLETRAGTDATKRLSLI